MTNTVYEDRMGSIFEIPNYKIQDRNTTRNSKKKPLGKHYHAGTSPANYPPHMQILMSFQG